MGIVSESPNLVGTDASDKQVEAMVCVSPSSDVIVSTFDCLRGEPVNTTWVDDDEVPWGIRDTQVILGSVVVVVVVTEVPLYMQRFEVIS
jgi:hypothetical protein